MKFKKGDIVVINQYAASREKFYTNWVGLRCEVIDEVNTSYVAVKPLQDRPDAHGFGKDNTWKKMGFSIQNEYLDLEFDLTTITPENYRID